MDYANDQTSPLAVLLGIFGGGAGILLPLDTWNRLFSLSAVPHHWRYQRTERKNMEVSAFHTVFEINK